MAVPNVNKLTSMLAKLQPDSALQQYAQMHKNDPYIMALAVSESNRRKELRAATQAPQGVQDQPKVADAALAQMAPSQGPVMMAGGGLAALPAPNMQMMADGGIAGYEGYDEGDSAYGQESIMRMAGGGAVERYQAGGSIADRYKLESQEMVSGNRVQYSPDVATFAQQLAAQERAARQAAESSYLKSEQQRMLSGPSGAEAPAAPKAPTERVTPTFSPDDYSGMDRRIMSGSQLPSIPSISPPAKAAPPERRVAAPRPDTGAGPRPGAGAAPEQSVAQRYAAMQTAMGLNDTSKEDAARAGVIRSMREQTKGELEEFEKDVAARGKYGEAKEARLAKREAELGKRKDENTGMALLEAGLAIMSTPGGLATAIGKGAQVGLKTYSAGLKDLRAAQEKMDDARDQIEEFRRNEANMTAKERRQFKSAIGRTETEIEKLGLDAAVKMTGEKRSDLRTLFTAEQQTILTDKEIKAKKDIAAMQERGANARAGALPGEVRAAMLLGTGTTDAERLTSGMAKYKELTGDKQGTQLLKLFLEENGRREKNMEKPLTLEQFRRTSAAFYAPPAPVDIGKPTRP